MIPDFTFEYKPPVQPRGPTDARILIVGEAPGEKEVAGGAPFLGASGYELDSQLLEVGIDPQLVRMTNVTNYRPDRNNINEFFSSSKKKSLTEGSIFYRGKYAKPILLAGIRALKEEIKRTRPNVVIAVGNAALWATTGEWGITKWRGSQMQGSIEDVSFKVVPIIHPAGVLRKWDWRWHTIIDLRRALRESFTGTLLPPAWNFLVRPSYSAACSYLNNLLAMVTLRATPVAVDIETRARHIACVGLATSSLDAVCIPFMCVESNAGYWSEEEEVNIWWLLYQILTHKNCKVIGQNFLYDNQYFVRRVGFLCNLTDDTMMKMHVLYPGAKKGLDFISSIFCDYHCYWKDDGKEWQKEDEETLWVYNCRDAVATYESNFAMDAHLDAHGLRDQYAERMAVSREVAFPMMLRGIAASMEQKRQLVKECTAAIEQRREFLEDVLQGYQLFGKKGGVSPQKMKKLCYEIFELPPQYRKDPVTKQNRLSCDKDAIEEWLTSCNILYRPILKTIKDMRSIAVFKNTFAAAPLDWDDRWRCSYNVAGPHTFRWSSSEDAFGFGANLQNIPGEGR